ncbi:MAG TPA: LysR family transcriptional regulator [Clostridia bacterium]|nr:LysR family transcriptional regulator [Clostridia bacterium]
MKDAPMIYTLSVRLYRGENEEREKCFGPGIAELLKRVDRTRSLRSAAAEMSLAYSKAWRIVKETEAALGFKLLISQTGGVNGGGASLTQEAHDMLARFDGFLKELRAAADVAFQNNFGNIS